MPVIMERKKLDFSELKVAVHKQFLSMMSNDNPSYNLLFRTDIDKDKMWELYLESFPEGTNPIFRERTEHDCQCCRQFIKAVGNVVQIKDLKLISIWDIEIGGQYQPVVDALSKYAKSKAIKDVFRYRENNVGTDFNYERNGNENIKWKHFHYILPNAYVDKDPGSYLSEVRSTKEVFQRSLCDITLDAANTVLELIEQNSIYRGEEHKGIVKLFLKHKVAYEEFNQLTKHQKKRDRYCWTNSMSIGPAAKIRNTAIGTLLIDISEGKELDQAVKSFENMVAPANYKRPTALITKSMIDNAQKKVKELGIEESLQRRYAVTEDITINNVLFANRETKQKMNVFDELKDKVTDKIPDLNKVEEVNIKEFIKNILPKSDSIELLFENRHNNNLVSLIAPTIKESPRIFKWDNNFSWSYAGEVADSIKERVKKAGGSVTGDLRCSLSWFNYDDLDLHLLEPTGGSHIYFENPNSRGTNGKLDVDMNAGITGTTRSAVENITYSNKNRMLEGNYKLYVNNFSKRESVDVGFDIEIEFNDIIYSFHYDKTVGNKRNVTVAEFNYSHKDGIEIIKSLPSVQASKEIWSTNTQKFQKVSMIMHSPNHWDGHKTGNKHWFFILDKCKNDKPARGFFNEFLKEDLREHRKVFEVLGSKMKTEASDTQLSGLGFSSTQKNNIYCRIAGSFSRIIKIIF